MTIKFEVGNFYKTREGIKVRCVATDGHKDYPIIFIKNTEGVISTTDEGTALSAHTQHQNDVISEWIESKRIRKTMYIAVLYDGKVSGMYTTEKGAMGWAKDWFIEGNFKTMPVEIDVTFD